MMGRRGACSVPAFYRDCWFLAAVCAGGVVWAGLWWLNPGLSLTCRDLLSWRFVALTLWNPCWEELLFRGYLQGALLRMPWGQYRYGGMSMANVVTAVMFMLGHWWAHPPLWAIAVLVPGLLFGACRDRYGSVVPAIVLHAVYNAGYVTVSGLPG